MKMKLMTAGGPTALDGWLDQPARDVRRDAEKAKPVQEIRKSWNPCTTAKAQDGPYRANLMSLQAEMRQNAMKEFWIVVVLWAASWGAVALICV